MNLDPVILRKLVNRRLFTAKDLLLATHLELVEGLDISLEAVGDLLLIVSNATAPRVSTVSAYRSTLLQRLSSGLWRQPPHCGMPCALQVKDLYARSQQQSTHLPTHLPALDAVLRCLRLVSCAALHVQASAPLPVASLSSFMKQHLVSEQLSQPCQQT